MLFLYNFGFYLKCEGAITESELLKAFNFYG